MNNFQKHQLQIQNLKGKPSLLIHVCCGVCSVWPLLYLRQYFKVTIFFSNSNIFPYDEYQRRLNALKTYLDYLNDSDIKLIEDSYDNISFTKDLTPYKDFPEGDKRCYICYTKRMRETFKYASKHHYEYCTTVMSISNRKKADYLNEIGENLEKEFQNVKYLYADFKKDDGITKNEELNKKYNLYHQDYCGCVYSIRE